MSLQAWFSLLPYILSALVSLFTSAYVYRRNRTPGAQPFARLALLESIWTVGYVCQLASPSLTAKLVWNNIQFIGAVFTPVAFFCFSVEYSGIKNDLLRKLRIGLSLLSGALLALIWTDSWHHLFRIAPYIVEAQPFPRLIYIDGPAFFLYPLIGYSLLSLGAYTLVKNLLSTSRIYRMQTLTVLVGILIPWVTTLVTWLNLVQVSLHDVTPLTFALSNFVVALALSRYGLFDMVPVAYDTLLDHMEDGLLVLDQQERIVDLNRTAWQLLHLSHLGAIGLPFRTVHPAFEHLVCSKRAGQSIEAVLKVNSKARFYEIRVMEMHDPRRSVDGWLVLLRDITELKENSERLHHLAITDPLTEIYNRRQFFAMAEVEMKRAARSRRAFALILIDIDHFKSVNDRFGHVAGDQVLQQAVTRFQQHLRPYDLIARYGGDEFIILLPETDLPAAYEIAERMRGCITDSAFVTQSGPVLITTSIGVATYDRSVHPRIDQLVDQADQALYDAKHHGRNIVCAWGQVAPVRLPFKVEP